MSRGRRFDDEPKLNMKKVFATVLAFVVMILIIISIKNLFTKEKITQEVAVQTTYFTIFNNKSLMFILSLSSLSSPLSGCETRSESTSTPMPFA